MVKYESLLSGSKAKKSPYKKEESSASESEEEEMMGEGKKKKGGLTYKQRCANLAKGRATRMANLAKKKKMGKGNYTQDYVDESQVNYAGSPLDIYYQKPEKQRLEELRERGENEGKGMGKKKSKGIADDMIQMGQTGEKRIKGGDMSFMKNAMHLGMSMPSEEQFKTGGKMKKDIPRKRPEMQLDVTGAVENLARLAEKFGLRLV